MTDDTGFAPNPLHGVLTLATCKPRIRKSANKDEWISGWTSREVRDVDGNVVKSEVCKLIYLARISEKLTFAEYWKQHQNKCPTINGIPIIDVRASCNGKSNGIYEGIDCGDNIYKPRKADADYKKPNDFEQIRNRYHNGEESKLHDLSGCYVLICDEFYYFGIYNALMIEDCEFCQIYPKWREKKIPTTDKTAKNIIDFVLKNKRKATISNENNIEQKGI